MKLTAYIPCFNNAATLAIAIESVLRQTVPPDELLVVDDGSTDQSVSVAKRLGARILRQERNLGRGAARARALLEARNELVLGCDATVVLPESFVQTALPYFHKESVAAVFGHFAERSKEHVVQRWRARHLYKQDQPRAVCRGASLVTAGAVQKRSHVLAVGNYNQTLRHSEDAELGGRLLSAGFEVISDPQLEFECLQGNSLGRLFERYWRWHAGAGGRLSVREYVRLVWYGLAVLARRDLQQKDFAAAAISLAMPHNQFWRSFLSRQYEARANGAFDLLQGDGPSFHREPDSLPSRPVS